MLTIVSLVPSGSATNPWTPALELHPRTMLWGPAASAGKQKLLGLQDEQPELLP